ncbi:MAG: hypothetical protein JST19_10125 [Bacteroidetes bacterium]|nr:hypothetical protein [Bacteroidota bacterium]
MRTNHETKSAKAGLKRLIILSLTIGLLCASSHVFAQSQASGGPPPPPPPPDELFKKINPFKKHKKDTANHKVDTAKVKHANTPPGGPPPPPPNPLNLFKKKRDTTKKNN